MTILVTNNDKSHNAKDADERSRDRAMIGRIGAYTSWANTPDRTARTEPARRAFLDSFEKKVDPDGVMTPSQRALAAEAARKAHYARLAHRSAQVRRRKRGESQ